MNLTFRQLKVFEAVARHLSYTRAAAELHLTQPAVSMQIKQLEETVGLPLFEQLGKKVYLTEAGKEFYHYSRSIAQQLSEVRQVLDELKGIQRGRLKISVATTAQYFAPRLLRTFAQRFQNVAVSMDVTNREALLRQLEHNEVDMAIMGQPPEGLDAVAEPFLQNPLVVIAPPDHPLAGTHSIPLATLIEEPFIVREQGSGTRSATERFFAKQGLHLSADMEMSSHEAVKQAVQAGLGLGIVSTHTINLELEAKRLVILDVQSLPIQRHWYLVHREGKRLSAVAQAFKDFVVAEAPQVLEQ
ncbi:MAG: LysR family transcriptional regulator [Pseudomonadota bacterium]